MLNLLETAESMGRVMGFEPTASWTTTSLACFQILRKLRFRQRRINPKNHEHQKNMKDPQLHRDSDAPDEEPEGTIYIITAEGTGLFKIGFATNLGVRLSSLQTGSPLYLSLVHTEIGPKSMESRTHHALSEYWAHGEWFWLPEDLVESIKESGISEALSEKGLKPPRRGWSRSIRQGRIPRYPKIVRDEPPESEAS